ncbi:MAG: hypothetical protein KAH32_07190, partial [Chlamydiia bacterium]|nr:hypothetical protein [Chlamydiia bacterium]
MKNIYKVFILLLLPFIGFGQTLTLGKGAKVVIGNNNETSGASFTTGDIDLTGGTGTNFRIFDLSKVTAGTIINAASNARLDIFTDADGAGSLICSGNPKARVRVLTKKSRWSQISPPVEGIVSGDFDQALKDSWLVWFDESAGAHNGAAGDGWEYITSLTDPVNPGEGRSFYRGGDKTHIFKGKIRTTNLDNSPTSFQLNYTDSDHGYNLIGNPFTSALLWDGTWTSTNLSNVIWIWNGSQYGASPGSLTNHNIALGQAFFVRATAAGATLTIPAAKRNHGASLFQKKDKNNGRNYVIINADNNGNKDVAYVYFDATGTEGYDD